VLAATHEPTPKPKEAEPTRSLNNTFKTLDIAKN
jgi:hypothetical protein